MTKLQPDQEEAFREALAGIGLSSAVIERMVVENREPSEDQVLAGVMRRLLTEYPAEIETYSYKKMSAIFDITEGLDLVISDDEAVVIERVRRG